MKRWTIGFAVLVAMPFFAGICQAVDIELVTVGNPGNANDSTGYGAVDYVYRMGKYEVTNSQYCEFLNAKAVTDTYGLYRSNSFINDNGGITRSGSSGSYTYAVKPGYEDAPVTHVRWYDAIRFVNWLQNGQGSGDTESGTYAITDGTYGTVAIPDAVTRATWTAANPHWVLPSEDEWYKAAYYQPVDQGGDTDNYWAYPTRTNSVPYSDQPPGSGAPVQANTANFFKYNSTVDGYDDGYATTGSISYLPVRYVTNVGAYTLSSSYYGTFDQGGNVREWNEALVGSSDRGLRGGSFYENSGSLHASSRNYDPPLYHAPQIGFRVALVPEPSAITLATFGLLALLAYGWRQGRR